VTFTAANLHPALSTRATELFGVQSGEHNNPRSEAISD